MEIPVNAFVDKLIKNLGLVNYGMLIGFSINNISNDIPIWWWIITAFFMAYLLFKMVGIIKLKGVE